MNITLRTILLLQVQDIEFAQIEMKVIEGLKVGNDCLKKMHEVHNEKFIIFLFVLGTATDEFNMHSIVSLFFFPLTRCCP